MRRFSSDRVTLSVQLTVFVFAVGFVVQLASERMYWGYDPAWFGSRVGEMLGTAGFYGIAALGSVWALGRIRFRGWHQVVLAGALFAWTVEGVIVYVLHEGGPFDPFFPAMFAGWHGLLSFVGLFYSVRRWLITGAWRPLAVAATSVGVLWGMWATNSWLPYAEFEAIAGEAEAAVLAPPGQFALVATLVTIALAAGHLLLDRVWPADWTPTRRSTIVVASFIGVYAAASVFVAVYAPARWGILVGILLLGLRASNREGGGPNLYSHLRGSVQASTLAAVLFLPASAVTTYSVMWLIGPTEPTLEMIYFSLVMLQVVAGGIGVTWALVRSFRTRRHPRVPPRLEPTSTTIAV